MLCVNRWVLYNLRRMLKFVIACLWPVNNGCKWCNLQLFKHLDCKSMIIMLIENLTLWPSL